MSMMVYSRFADLLDYPGPDIAARVEACLAELDDQWAEPRVELTHFKAKRSRLTLGQLEEAYTQAFELRPESTPNLGHHLFGEDVRRSIFMAHLKQRMKAHGIDLGVELPDHWSLVLRLLARQESPEEIQALVEDCLLPAISRILKVLERSVRPSPYTHVLRALLEVLRKSPAAGAFSAEPATPAASAR